MAKHIESQKGLKTLLERYQAVGADKEQIAMVQGCIKDGLAMDEDDYEFNTPNELKQLWKGLK